ncbi:hypothetical protein BAU15_12300 [Enterococcus sp. JM4C]|uniref:hypothetical protein n=1 Tax=Candidatus Enterococcus huntleyi TaxID=1857217 RepID=UPI00137AB8E7|nr:hypothetical protein [Enterococcus sp. JM4C]KAF1296056.1 hypothetical protein BAU15_12300 [Enterococcus sp. JM4C]
MKKTILICLGLSIFLGVTGCSSQSNKDMKENNSSVTEETTENSNESMDIDTSVSTYLEGKWRFVKGYPTDEATVDDITFLEPFGEEDSLYIIEDAQRLMREQVWSSDIYDDDANLRRGFSRSYYQFVDYEVMKKSYDEEKKKLQDEEEQRIKESIKENTENIKQRTDSTYDGHYEKDRIEELEKQLGEDHTTSMYAFKTLEDYNRALAKIDFKVTNFEKFYFISPDEPTAYILLDNGNKLALTSALIGNQQDSSYSFDGIYLFERVVLSSDIPEGNSSSDTLVASTPVSTTDSSESYNYLSADEAIELVEDYYSTQEYSEFTEVTFEIPNPTSVFVDEEKRFFHVLGLDESNMPYTAYGVNIETGEISESPISFNGIDVVIEPLP